jgi:hypothetical protein
VSDTKTTSASPMGLLYYLYAKQMLSVPQAPLSPGEAGMNGEGPG